LSGELDNSEFSYTMPSKVSQTTASVTKESARILRKCLVNNVDLDMPASVKEQLSLVNFSPETAPFIPTPMKITESCSALWGCIGLYASAISQERYHSAKPKKIEVDVYSASLMLFSLVLIELEGKGISDAEVVGRTAYLDKGGILEPYRGLASNMYNYPNLQLTHLADTKEIKLQDQR
jgi:hypothetical protein